MILSNRQFECITLLTAEEQLEVLQINVLTLASLLRRGLVKPFRRNKFIVLTPLGVETYKLLTTRKVLKWKQELQAARELKYGKQ